MEDTCYDVEIEKLRLYSHLAQSVNDVRQGRIEKIDTAFDDVLSELDGEDEFKNHFYERSKEEDHHD